MRGLVFSWPDLFRAGFDTKVSIPASHRRPRQIVMVGMGGSAAGAGLLEDYLSPDLSIPYLVHRDYGLPVFVGKSTLVICVSHSGNTEETLDSYAEARKRGAKTIAITTGGKLADQAKRDKVPLVRFGNDLPPRAALPQVLGLLLRIFSTAGFVTKQDAEVTEALGHLDQVSGTVAETEQHAAAELAKALRGKVPIIYGAGLTAAAARRLKAQISENAKQTAAFEVVPEVNHNALAGLEFPNDLAEHVIFVMLRTGHEHPLHALRFEFISEALEEKGLRGATLRSSGPNRLAHLLTIIFLGDVASLMLSAHNKVDPTPVDIIDRLKQRLSDSGVG